jgi:Cu/Ag efflux protein CusF
MEQLLPPRQKFVGRMPATARALTRMQERLRAAPPDLPDHPSQNSDRSVFELEWTERRGGLRRSPKPEPWTGRTAMQRREFLIAIGGAAAARSFCIAPGAVAETQEKPVGEAEGTIKGVDASEHMLLITHGPITGGVQMPAMTMSFHVAPGVDFSKLEKGKKIKFAVTRDEKGLYLITRVDLEN